MLKTYEELYPSSITKYLKKHDLHCVRKSKGVFKFIPRVEYLTDYKFIVHVCDSYTSEEDPVYINVQAHAAGELQSCKELKMWLETANLYPDIPFYVYTKAYDKVDKVLSSIKECNIPKNFYINISIWHQSGIKTYNKWKHLDTIRAFVYDDGYDYSKKLKIDCYCPAYDKNGKLSHELTCDKCKICFQKKAKVCGCYDH